MALILIVDDDHLNRELLRAHLEGLGHTLLQASAGEEALLLVDEHNPDLVLLDVVMPGLSGFDTVALIKEQTKDRFLPVVLITALADQESRTRGLRAGADEFLTKPVDRSELLVRIGHLLELREKDATLALRNVELVELHRFRDEMSTMLVHDLKNPLSVMLANTDYLIELGAGQDNEGMSALHDTRSAGQRALRLLSNLLDVARMEAGKLGLKRAKTEFASFVEPLLAQRSHLAGLRSIQLSCSIEDHATVVADPEIMSRVVENIFDNAFRYTPTGGRIAVETLQTGQAVQLRIGNTGDAIPAEDRARIFERFAQTGRAVGRMNLGLGLYFCRLATEAHGGRIWVEQTRELPTVFGIELPR